MEESSTVNERKIIRIYALIIPDRRAYVPWQVIGDFLDIVVRKEDDGSA